MPKNRQAYSIVFSIVMLLFSMNAAQALEKLIYDADISALTAHKISKHETFNSIALDALDVAKADLNQDGIPELIIREKTCLETDEMCDYHVMADTQDSLFVLVSFKAKYLAIGQEKSSGVRNILVFKNQLNDFDYDVYTWNANNKNFERVQ